MHSMNQRADVSNSLATGLGLGFASESLSCINDTIHQQYCYNTSPIGLLGTAVSLLVLVLGLGHHAWTIGLLAYVIPDRAVQ